MPTFLCSTNANANANTSTNRSCTFGEPIGKAEERHVPFAETHRIRMAWHNCANTATLLPPGNCRARCIITLSSPSTHKRDLPCEELTIGCLLGDLGRAAEEQMTAVTIRTCSGVIFASGVVENGNQRPRQVTIRPWHEHRQC